jgi:hypothetical protein
MAYLKELLHYLSDEIDENHERHVRIAIAQSRFKTGTSQIQF